MPEAVNTSKLEIDQGALDQEDNDREVVIDVNHVSMKFNMASESLTNLKEYAIKLIKGELFFEEFNALEDITFQVKRGDVYGIMGTNGSGKSTLLKIIAGVLEPTAGSCSIKGTIAPLIELGAGFDNELSARENIYLNGALLGYSHDFIDEYFDQIVEFAEIEKFLDMPLKNYSSGMVSRIAFAIATVIIPEVLLVDEVLSVGDFMFQKKCERRITELIEKHGVTVLIVSHSNDQIARLCNKCIWIEKGHTRIKGSAPLISHIYGTLGGRVGSSDSESVVFDALKKQLSAEPAVKPSAIPYQGPAQAAVALAKRAWSGAAPKTVILAAAQTHITIELSAPLSKALDAPIIMWDFDDPSIESMFYLQTIKPSRIIALDCRDPEEGPDLSADDFDWDVELTILRSKPAYSMSQKVYDLGKELGIWGQAACIAEFDDGGVLSFAVAIFAARNKMPVFVRGDQIPDCFDNLAATLKKDGISQVYFCGPVIEDRFKGSFTNEGIAVKDAARDADVSKLWDLQRRTADRQTLPVEEAFVAPPRNAIWQRFFGVVSYLVKRNGVIMYDDNENLDSVAEAIRATTELANVQHVSYFAGNDCLSESDINLLTAYL